MDMTQTRKFYQVVKQFWKLKNKKDLSEFENDEMLCKHAIQLSVWLLLNMLHAHSSYLIAF